MKMVTMRIPASVLILLGVLFGIWAVSEWVDFFYKWGWGGLVLLILLGTILSFIVILVSLGRSVVRKLCGPGKP
jgi:hypothetical protein